MKPWFLLILLLICTPLAARAQVSVNAAALDQLAGITAVAPPPLKPPKPVHAAHPVVRARHRAVLTEAPHPAPPIAAAARLAPPALAAPPPAKPIVVAPSSLVFAPGSATLPANASNILKPFCQAARDIGIDARAPPDANGVSGAMRLSLARALAVRDALLACGVAPANLLPRALGSAAGVDDNVTTISSGPQK